TWGQLAAECPTNVVLGAQMVLPRADDGTQQLVLYKEGVGTSYLINKAWESRLAGAFGWGLFDNIADAYRFLVFNYRTGDEIFIFGFSRGAFTARSLAGMIRKCGIVAPDRLHKVEEAFTLYKTRGDHTHPDGELAQRFRAENAPEMLMKDLDRDWRQANGFEERYEDLPNFAISYLGVWDTVGALGIPRHFFLERLFRTAEKYQFHDLVLSSIVAAGRHAVAIYEDRLSFEPTLWENLDELNAERPGNYEEQWFPGTHGSVGGGGQIRGLSNAALLWIMEGAARAGLGLDEAAMENAAREVEPYAPLSNLSVPPGALDRIYRRGNRSGPTAESRLARTTLVRVLRSDQAGPVADDWSRGRRDAGLLFRFSCWWTSLTGPAGSPDWSCSA